MLLAFGATVVSGAALSWSCNGDDAGHTPSAPPPGAIGQETRPRAEPVRIDSETGQAVVEMWRELEAARSAWRPTLDKARRTHPLVEAYFVAIASGDYALNLEYALEHRKIAIALRGLESHARPWGREISSVAVPVCSAASDQRRAGDLSRRAAGAARKRFESDKAAIDRDAASRRREACRTHFANFHRDMKVTVRCDGSKRRPTFSYPPNLNVVGVDKTIAFALGKYLETVAYIDDDVRQRLRQARQDADAHGARLGSEADAAVRKARTDVRALATRVREVRANAPTEPADRQWREARRLFASARPDAASFGDFEAWHRDLALGDLSYDGARVVQADVWTPDNSPLKDGLRKRIDDLLGDAAGKLRSANGKAACTALRKAENMIEARIRDTKALSKRFERGLTKEATNGELPFPSPILCCALGRRCCPTQPLL